MDLCEVGVDFDAPSSLTNEARHFAWSKLAMKKDFLI